jgi:uncharacterized membrane protein YdjX (TVP38/TMEM64 family)/Fe-S oxidoreductase
MGNKLTSLSEEVVEKCIACPLCRRECAFLEQYGNPKEIADRIDFKDDATLTLAYECSLCGLCGAVCPVRLEPRDLFLEMRRTAVARGIASFPEHKLLLAYENRGISKRYSYYALPEGCHTVFFPGCALPGTRPKRTFEVYNHLRPLIPGLGIVLDCCTKPSHDLGRQEFFQTAFGEMKDYLFRNGVRTVLTACPNCYRVFKEYGDGLGVKTVYEALAEQGPNKTAVPLGGKPVVLHDPCAIRGEIPVHDTVRDLLQQQGLPVEEMPHHGLKTLCCGEGGAVGLLAPELAGRWGQKRKTEADNRAMITYCVGCSSLLGKLTPTHHLLDLVFDPEATLRGRVKPAGPPWSYWNRLKLKRQITKSVTAPVRRERNLNLEPSDRQGAYWRIGLLLILIGAIIAIRTVGLTRYLEQENLRNLIQNAGLWAPAIYMLTYTLAPALFLPGLPVTIIGGILFGPFWGVVYSIVGATAGACLAFLISRYAARGWIEEKLKSPRWKKLDEGVENQGWKIVALTRLIPLFPFNLLNYAFGLTKIGFVPYALATFLFMLPACIAFIVFSSSLLNLLKGRISGEFLIGLSLLIAVSLIPMVYRKLRKKSPQ